MKENSFIETVTVNLTVDNGAMNNSKLREILAFKLPKST